MSLSEYLNKCPVLSTTGLTHSESDWKKLGRQNEKITTVMIALN